MQQQTIIIAVQPDGNVQMKSNIENKVFALGLLDIAKQLVLNPPKEEQPRIAIANTIPRFNGR